MKSIAEISVISKVPDLQVALEEERTQEFYFKVKELTNRLPKQGRCSICTLKIPCKHFSSPSDQPIPPDPPSPSPQLLSLINGLHSTFSPLPSLELSKDRSFSVRYRGANQTLSHPNHDRNFSLPTSDKLKTLEQIELYREAKIQNQIEKMKKLREKEVKVEQEEQKKDEKRKRHAKELRMRIEQYKEEHLMRQEQVRIMVEEEKKRNEKEEARRKAYLLMRQKELNEYRNKKFMLDQISRQKMQDLQKDFADKHNWILALFNK